MKETKITILEPRACVSKNSGDAEHAHSFTEDSRLCCFSFSCMQIKPTSIFSAQPLRFRLMHSPPVIFCAPCITQTLQSKHHLRPSPSLPLQQPPELPISALMVIEKRQSVLDSDSCFPSTHHTSACSVVYTTEKPSHWPFIILSAVLPSSRPEPHCVCLPVSWFLSVRLILHTALRDVQIQPCYSLVQIPFGDSLLPIACIPGFSI